MMVCPNCGKPISAGGHGRACARSAERTRPETRVAAVKQVPDTKLAQYGGTWSATYIDLESGRDVTVNDEKLVAASLVKLYIMLAVFDGIEHGTITDDANVDALLKQMITVSSNEAANGLLSRIGNGDGKDAIATVTATAQRYGFTSSEELRTLTGMASGNAVENWTSTRDCGSFLSQVYAGTLVSKNASERMMQLLHQDSRGRAVRCEGRQQARRAGGRSERRGDRVRYPSVCARGDEQRHLLSRGPKPDHRTVPRRMGRRTIAAPADGDCRRGRLG